MRKSTATILGVVGAFGMALGCAVDAADDDVATAEQGLECNTQTGINPVKAALAVAMAREMGELDPLKYFAWSGGPPWIDRNGKLGLSSAGETRCNQTGGCGNLKSILALQSSEVSKVIPGSVLDVTALKNDLYASFNRQKDKIAQLAQNEPWNLPPAHALQLAGTVDRASCGLHFEFDASKPGTTTPVDNPEDLVYQLYFFGVNAGNTFIDFYSTDAGIGIDPTVSLTGTIQTAGTCGIGFTVYDPTWYSYGKCCYYNSKYGKWAVASWAANTFYCKI